jgi:CBS domain-containing protein
MYRVKDILFYKSGDIWSLPPTAPIADALHLLDEKDVGALLVLDEGRIVGIISERDFVRSIAREGQVYFFRPISEYMTRKVITIAPENTIDECMQMMTHHHIRHLPVVDERGHLVGMISIGDVLKQHIQQQESTIQALENYIGGRDYAR